MKRLVLLAAAGAVALAVAIAALAAGNGEKALRSTLAPSVPTDPAFHAVLPGSAPWMLSRGEVRIKDDGEFDLEVQGLVIPSLGTPGPVTAIAASLFCGPDTNTAPVFTTNEAPLSSSGDATISQDVVLPSTCLAPIVVVNPDAPSLGGLFTNRYIAITGWKS